MSEQQKTEKKGFSRRKFLIRTSIGVGGALIIGAVSCNPLRRMIAGFANEAELAYNGETKSPFLWFEIKADNQIVLHSPKVEMGQGVFTGLSQIAADELDVDMEQLKVVHATTASGNIDPRSTGGSDSTSGLWQPLRELAATTREMIKQEAAKKWG